MEIFSRARYLDKLVASLASEISLTPEQLQKINIPNFQIQKFESNSETKFDLFKDLSKHKFININMPNEIKNSGEVSGTWSENLSWVFKTATELPKEQELFTATFCVLKNKEGKIVLIKNDRSWGLPGGHIESGEKAEDSIKREIKEEVGVNIDEIVVAGYREIISQKPIINDTGVQIYPHPKTYNIFYSADLDSSNLGTPSGTEVLEFGLFNEQEIRDKLSEKEFQIIQEILKSQK